MKRKVLWSIVLVVSLSAFLYCGWNVGTYYYNSYQYQKKVEAQAKLIKDDTKETQNPEQTIVPTKEPDAATATPLEATTTPLEPTVSPTPTVLDKYADMLAKYKDFIGWITIEGTKIDYPVMQAEDNKTYLKHDMDGNEDKHGVLFLDYKNDILKPSTNLIIYGHNMKDGSMFASLHKYDKKSFYKKHKIITFNTIYEDAEYEIVAVFYSKVFNKDDDDFKYYQFFEAENEDEFNDFYKNIKKMSIYDTGVEASYGDQLLTLSTCSYHVKNGRLAVVAKKIK